MTYPQQPPPQQPYGPPAGYPVQPAVRTKGSNRTVLIVVGVVTGVVLLVCGGLTVLGLVVGPDTTSTAAIPTAATTKAAPVAAPSLTAAPTAPAAPPTSAAAAPPPVEEPPTEAKVPNLVGENAAVAEDELKRLGFTNIQFGSQDEFDTFVVLPQNWTVKKQSAKAGKTLPLDSLIVLTCTKMNG